MSILPLRSSLVVGLLASVPLILAAAPLPASASTPVGTVRFGPTLSQPTWLTAPPGDTTRAFVTERLGTIEILDATTGAQNAAPFLTIPGVDGTGLQGLVFDPDYDTNGYFYVDYSASDVTHVVRYSVSTTDPDVADPLSAHPILDLPTDGGHAGGWLGFGPDGYLYIHVGDSGRAVSHDPDDNGQSTTGELLANVLRIDPDGDDFPADPDRNYAVPPTNPFVGMTGEDEIWAFGLRNPFRGCFDRHTGDYYIADVGQDAREEVNYEPAGTPGGRNYGWRLREGSIATPTGGVGGPQPPGGVDPHYEYLHGTGTFEGGSITGGCVYRGPVWPLQGLYFFGDFVSSRIWSLQNHTGIPPTVEDWTSTFAPPTGSIDDIIAFGEDGAGDMYVVDYDGEIYKIVGPTAAVPLPPAALIGLALGMTGLGGWSLRRAFRGHAP